VQTNSSTPVLNLIESRYDWITATAKKEGLGGDLFEFGMNQMEAAANAGAKQRAWYWQGYTGFHSGNWSVGWGREGAIVVATQEGSEIGHRTLANLADHWSRCDMCVTGVDPTLEYSPVGDYWNLVKPGTTRRANAPIATVILNSKRGETFYLGRRSAAYYLRVYNKYIESDGEYPEGAWRFELEMKRHASEAEQLRVKDLPLGARKPTDVVATELFRQGLPVPWANDAPVDRAKTPPRRKELERALTWLQDQVAPTVEYVIQTAGARRAREALNL
jgi:hypothetical protein